MTASIRRRKFLAAIGGAAAWPLGARAQQPTTPTAGYLSGNSAGGAPQPGEPPNANPIRSLLKAVGVPWQSSRAALTEQYGIRLHPAYQWEVVEITTSQPIVKGLLWPLWIQVSPNFSPHVPATYFAGRVYLGDDARQNLHACVEQLLPILGAPRVTDRSNTVARSWSFGSASLTLTVWPRDLQRWPTAIPAHDRDPRLKTACDLAIETGFRKTATAVELTWLNGFVPVGRVQVGGQITASAAYGSPAPENELEFVREPIAELAHIFSSVGHSPDHEALIFWHTQLYLVPMADIVGFTVDRIRPARGPGGSQLYVECRTNYQGVATKRLMISSAPGVEDSNELASVLSTVTGKPFRLGNYAYDD